MIKKRQDGNERIEAHFLKVGKFKGKF